MKPSLIDLPSFLSAALGVRGRAARIVRVVGGFAWVACAWFSWCAGAAEWQNGNGFRSQALEFERGSPSGFARVSPAATGVAFTNVVSVDRYTTNQIYLNGSGVCAGDVDGDGWADLFFAGMGGRSALFRNRGGWRFEAVTEASGITAACATLDATGAALVDLEGDGDLDLIVNSIGGGTQLLINDGRGKFTRGALLNPARGGSSLALADLDGDGDLDLYVANYRTETLRDQPRTNFRIEKTNGLFVVALVNGRPTTSPDLEGRFSYDPSGTIRENGEPDAVFRNQGHGEFVPLSFTGGTFLDEGGQALARPLYDWGLSVMLRDLTGDGLPDIYVCNDFASVDRFWVNQGAGRFRAAPALALRNTCKFSMGVEVADVNRDGIDDLYVLDMMSRDHAVRLTRMDATMESTPLGVVDSRPQFTRSTLHLGRGDGTFAEIAQYAGLEASEWAWNPLFLDVDLDGFEDLLVATGHARDDMHLDYGMRIEAQRRATRMSTADELALRKGTPPVRTPCLAYRNRGDLRFEEMKDGWGWGDQPAVSQGACLVDLDNDGDLDVVVNRLNDAAAIYRNLGSQPRIAVRLKGVSPNTRGIGARIELSGGPGGRQAQELICGGRYLSSDDAMRVFAAGTGEGPLKLEVRWPSGRHSTISPVQPNRLYEIDEGSSTPPVAKTPETPVAPLFADESARLGYRHYEAPFDDFERQPLLPRRGSQAGPGLAWLDLNGDGREDLFVASGKGGRPGLFLGTGNGQFAVVEPDPVARDQTGVVAWNAGTNGVVALVTSSAYETPEAGGAGVEVYDRAGSRTELLGMGGESPGAIALGDLDGDGDLDLFVGGGPVGGRYPESSPSRIFERQGDQWRLSETNTRVLAEAGLVSGACWTDLDGDGRPELVMVGEWGPVRIFQNDKGQLREVTKERGLASSTGWWTGVAVGDFDEDGRLDLVAGNWGLNSRYRPTATAPVRLYFGDLAGQGQMELIESAFDAGSGRWLPERDLNAMSARLPWLRARFGSHADYARASVDDLLAGQEAKPRILEAAQFATTLFLNRGDHFEAVNLPAEAQWSTVFGVSVADFDLDGHLDVFLAQNFFGVNPMVSRQDAGRGLLLLGDGRGGFRAVDGSRSGIRVYGEQRGTAVADYDGDGRPDLAVAQNAAELRLFRNTTTSPGLRVLLRGTGANPRAIGARIRFRGGEGSWGPAQEIHAGSGYRSQDGDGLFLPRGRLPGTVEVHWPGGPVSRHELVTNPRSNTVTLAQPRALP